MNKPIGIQLAVSGVLLAGLALLAERVDPAAPREAILAGLLGGALCVVWGARAWRGNAGRGWALLTLIPLSFALLAQSILAWDRCRVGSGPVFVAAIFTVQCVLALSSLARVANAGVIADGPPSPPAESRSAGPPRANVVGSPGHALPRR